MKRIPVGDYAYPVSESVLVKFDAPSINRRARDEVFDAKNPRRTVLADPDAGEDRFSPAF
ncbi:MAG: hypothetical protein HZB51_00825 [Chloroflexi bacterium]|nr:hypothetical protein [Chloroflexota bacterium]